MKAEFSEFSYGFSFTENLIRSKSSVVSAPLFLNQVREYEWGCDLALELDNCFWKPLFFQFKVPDIMTTKRAREISKFSLNISLPFFRMHLHRKNAYNQQRALAKLDNDFLGSAFYATPRFHEYPDLNKHFKNGEVHKHSALFSPTDIDKANVLSGGGDHAIAYEANKSYGWLCSETRKIGSYNIDEIVEITDKDTRITEMSTEKKIEEIFRSFLEIPSARRYGLTRESIDLEENRIREIIGKRFDDQDPHSNLPKIQTINSISRSIFGSEMLFSLRRKQ